MILNYLKNKYILYIARRLYELYYLYSEFYIYVELLDKLAFFVVKRNKIRNIIKLSDFQIFVIYYN